MKTTKKLLALILALLMLTSAMALPASAATPAAPSNVTVERSTSSIRLSWPKVSGATGYRIHYKLPGDLSWRTAVSSTTKTTHTFNALSAGVSYKFAVQSYVKSGSKTTWGSYKEIVTATQTIPGSGEVNVYTSGSLQTDYTGF